MYNGLIVIHVLNKYTSVKITQNYNIKKEQMLNNNLKTFCHQLKKKQQPKTLLKTAPKSTFYVLLLLLLEGTDIF